MVRLNRMLKGKQYENAKYYIIVDENTYSHCLPELISHVSALEQAEFFEVPVGEECKSIEVATQLWGALLDAGADRNSVIVNLGGGCVSDLGGFVAAGYKRGIRYINIPTTLIGMVDAAIGGKTAINMENTKNTVGFFHHPEAVVIHPQFLSTLPEDEIKSGLFEMTKSLLILDETMLNNLESALLAKDKMELSSIIELTSHCADFKCSVVEADEKELSIRKILNIGHTFGHGIESFMMEKGTPLSHGKSIGLGLACELYLSVKKLGMSKIIYNNYCKLLHRLVNIPRFSLRDAESILSFMRNDKKNRDGLILCVLLKAVGEPVIDVAIDENEVRDALLQLKNC